MSGIARIAIWIFRDRVRLSLAVLFLLLTALYVEHGGPLGGDGHYYFLHLRSLIMDGDLSMENEYRMFGNPFEWERVPETGRLPNWYAIGPAILWTPFYLVAHGCAHVQRLFDASVSLDGFRGIYQSVTFFGSLVYFFLTLLIGFRIACRFVSREIAALAVVAIALASSLFYFALYATSYSHAASSLLVALLVLYWLESRDRQDPVRWLVLGLLCGVAGLMRAQNLLFAFVPAVEWFAVAIPSVRKNGGGALVRMALAGFLAAVGLLAGFLPQLLAWKYYYGSMTGLLFQSGFMHWQDPFVFELLFSSRNGFLSWTPFLYLAIAGFAILVRRDRLLGTVSLLGFAIQTYVNACAWPWWSGFSFGQRRFLSLSALFVVGAALFLGWLVGWLKIRRAIGRLAFPMAVTVVACFSLLCISMTHRVKTHKLPTSDVMDMPDVYGEPMKTVLGPIYDVVGNPASLPASLYYWLRYDLHPRDFDTVIGTYFAYRDSREPAASSQTLWFSDPGLAPFLRTGGSTEGRPVRTTKILLPLYVPGECDLDLVTSGSKTDHRIRLKVNGQDLEPTVSGPKPGSRSPSVHWADPDSGMNILEIESPMETTPPRGLRLHCLFRDRELVEQK